MKNRKCAHDTKADLISFDLGPNRRSVGLESTEVEVIVERGEDARG